MARPGGREPQRCDPGATCDGDSQRAAGAAAHVGQRRQALPAAGRAHAAELVSSQGAAGGLAHSEADPPALDRTHARARDEVLAGVRRDHRPRVGRRLGGRRQARGADQRRDSGQQREVPVRAAYRLHALFRRNGAAVPASLARVPSIEGGATGPGYDWAGRVPMETNFRRCR
jgi:hypothetical protein